MRVVNCRCCNRTNQIGIVSEHAKRNRARRNFLQQIIVALSVSNACLFILWYTQLKKILSLNEFMSKTNLVKMIQELQMQMTKVRLYLEID